MRGFIVTVSRGYGSGGRTIGRRLAERLGVSCYDRELLSLASRESGINEALFAKADERLKNTLLFQVAQSVYSGEDIPPDTDDVISNDKLFQYQQRVLKGLAARESFVVIGRCADYVLRDYPNLLRVFIHAPFEACVAAEAGRSSLTQEEIRKYIRAVDKHRAEYYQHYTGKAWNDVSNYDLCLDSSTLGRDSCVSLLWQCVEQRFGDIQ